MGETENEGREPSIDAFLRDEPPSLEAWRWLWEGDHPFPMSSHRGFVGRLIVAAKKLLRGFVRAPQSDLWERQRAYNLFLQSHLERSVESERVLRERLTAQDRQLSARLDMLGRDLQTVQKELGSDILAAQEAATRDMQAIQEDVRQVKDEIWEFLQSQHERVGVLEGFFNQGWGELKDLSTALFSRLDQKLDYYRDLSKDRWDRLGALLEAVQKGGSIKLAQTLEEEKYVEFEAVFRGREGEISDRLKPYLEILANRSPVLDLGCGRGEALEVMSAHGITCRGVDRSEEMIERCRAKGLEAEVGDLFEAIAGVEEESLGGVVSFHVIEHLSVSSIDRLVRLCWRALTPGGVLIFETPNPLSLLVGARNFWIDPTHLRPVHPESLQTIFDLNGFDPVERLDLQAFPPEDRLPEIPLEGLDAKSAELAVQVNRLRDRLDSLLFGFQDYALVGYKDRRAAGGRR